MKLGTEKSLKFVNFGVYSFNLGTNELKIGNETVALRPKAGCFLKMLIEAEGEIVSHQDLYEGIWGETVVQRLDGLHQLAKDVRHSLSEENCDLVINIPGVGYKFSKPRYVARHGTQAPIFSTPVAYFGGVATLPVAFLLYCLAIGLGFTS